MSVHIMCFSVLCSRRNAFHSSALCTLLFCQRTTLKFSKSRYTLPVNLSILCMPLWISSRSGLTSLPPSGRSSPYHVSKPLGSLHEVRYFQYSTWQQNISSIFFFFFTQMVSFFSSLGLTKTYVLIALPFIFMVHFGSCWEQFWLELLGKKKKMSFLPCWCGLLFHSLLWLLLFLVNNSIRIFVLFVFIRFVSFYSQWYVISLHILKITKRKLR